jgi:putative ABC transport system ATP-binding protein
MTFDTTTDAETTDPAPMYQLENASRIFKRGGHEVRAVDDIDLDIERGEFVAIEGASGSGKSTLLQLLGALDKPTSGTLKLDGRDLADLSAGELTEVRLRHIGFVFQQFNLLPTLSAAENIEVALAPAGTKKRARTERAIELLTMVGLAERADHLPSRLSGGEQQRVAIARALANGPSVLLADEPTGNLDSRTAEEVVDVLARLSADHGVTLVLVTHADTVARRASRRVHMKDGKVFEGATGSIWAAPDDDYRVTTQPSVG